MNQSLPIEPQGTPDIGNTAIEDATPSSCEPPRIGRSRQLWRWLLLAVAVLAGLVVAGQVRHAALSTMPGRVGTHGFKFSPADAQDMRRLLEVPPASALAAHGARVGDTVRFVHRSDIWRNLRPGEPIALTLAHGGRHESLVVPAVAFIPTRPWAYTLAEVLSATTSVAGLGIGLALSRRRHLDTPLRLMALVGLAGSAINGVPSLPGGLLEPMGLPLMAALYCTVFAGFAAFCLRYPDDASGWRRPAVRRLFGVYTLVLVASHFIAFVRPPGTHALRDGAVVAGTVSQLLGLAIAVFGLVRAFRMTRGLQRERVAWIGLSIGIALAASTAFNVLDLLGVEADQELGGAAQMGVMLAAVGTLGYATLRGRVLDSGFALNRTLVWVILGLLMGAALWALLLGADWLLPAEMANTHWRGVIAGVGAVVVAPGLRALAEWIVASLLFPRWRQAAQALDAAIAAAATVRGREPLVAHYLAALRAYANGAPAAFFTVQDGMTERTGDWPALPARLDTTPRDRAVLREGRLPPALAAAAGDNAVLAPVTHRHQITGYLVLGPRPDFHAYRPDERRRVREAAVLLGVDLQAEAHRMQQALLAAKAEAEAEARKTAEQLRDVQRELVRRFATPEVAADLEAQGFALGGRSLRATTLFCDIRGFTALAESLPPEQTIEVLNAYYALMFEAIARHGGVVNQIVGDGLMAIFGAPVPLEDAAGSAVRAACAMQAALDVHNAQRAMQGKAPLRIGIGIATGDVIAGYTGTEQRATYTCVGDTVNLAARLEAMTKELRCTVLIDDQTRHSLAPGQAVEPLGHQTVRGRLGTVEVFTLAG